ncbi:LysR family transcriptional regulator [Candidatus Methylospira mobilis]|nr:LysR family transcriptional regulator [Candidatus Methylospira mobilis]
MSTPKVTLEQWRTLVSVVEAGGYAQAAEQLHKSQSTLTYAVQKLERLLGVNVFEILGRKAELTSAGQVLYRRGKTLIDEAVRLERAAVSLASGWEPELRIAVDTIFPTWLLLECFARFAEEHPETRIELIESVLYGTHESLLEGHVDLAIGPLIPPGFMGDTIMNLRFIAVAHPDHPLHRLDRVLTLEDLRRHRHLVIRDSSRQRAHTPVWLNEQRWTVGNKATSIQAACMGLGYAWYAEDSIRKELDAGLLKPLPLREGAERWAMLYLIFADRDAAGPGALRIAGIIREGLARHCPRARAAAPAAKMESEKR